jgi:hypothetical protein
MWPPHQITRSVGPGTDGFAPTSGILVCGLPTAGPPQFGRQAARAVARPLHRDSLDLVTSGSGRYPPPAARAASGRSRHSSPRLGHAGARRQSARPTSFPFRYTAYQAGVVNACQRPQLTFFPDTLPASPPKKDRNRLAACFPPQHGELVGPLPFPVNSS